MDDPTNDILTVDELRTLRRDNPQALYRHLTELQQAFLFGVEDHRDEPEEWGGEARVTINRNLVLHLVPTFNKAMGSASELPQFSVMPNEERADHLEETETKLDDGDVVKGVIFYVEPLDYDAIVRDAIRIAEEYPGWDAIPDSYYLDSELVRYLARVVLEHSTVRAEREYDFRMGLPGGAAAPALNDDEQLSAEDLIEAHGGDDDDDREPPLEGIRSHPVEWG